MTGQDKNKWVETLLKASPLEVADDGFSRKILANIKAAQRRRLMVLVPCLAIALGLLVVFFPYDILTNFETSLAGGYDVLVAQLTPVVLGLTAVLVLFFSEKEV